MKTRKQKGTGIFKNVLNFFSGRKTARRKAMNKTSLSNENQARKKKLEKKWFKTKKNKEELKLLKAKIGKLPSNEYKEYMKQLKRQANTSEEGRARLAKELKRTEPGYALAVETALEDRPRIQKMLNRFYTNKPVIQASLVDSPVEGVLTVAENTRFPLSKEGLKVPNSEVPTPPPKPQNEKTINGLTLPTASQKDIEYMITPLIFAEWRQRRNLRTGELLVPTSVEAIPDAEFERFLKALEEVEELPLEEQTKVLFQGRTVDEMDKFVNEAEQGAISGRTKIFLSRNKNPNGTTFYTRKFGDRGSGGIGRLLGNLRQGKKTILRQKEQDISRCVKDSGKDGRYTPLTTLKSNQCIFVGKGLENFTELQISQAPDMLKNNWILLAPQYFPIRDPFLLVVAKFFQTESYIQEAFENWGIEGIDIAFLELFQAKYPELAIQISTFLVNTEDFVYQKKKLKPFENFLLVDKGLFKEEIGLTTLYPFAEPSKYASMLQRAIQNNKLYGMTPYMAYIMKKKSLDLWNQGFEAEGHPNSTIYQTLSSTEKIVVDYLQYIRFMDKLEDSNYNFEEAHSTYKDFLGEGTPWSGTIKELVDLYKEDIGTHKKEIAFYQELVKRQLKAQENASILQTPDEISLVLSKFKPLTSNRNSAPSNENTLSQRTSSFQREEEPRRSFAPVRTVRRTFAPTQPLGAFNQAVLDRKRTPNQIRQDTQRKIQELDRLLANLRERYEALLAKYESVNALRRKFNFIQRKLKYTQGATRKVDPKNQAVVDEYMLMKTYLAKQEERQRLMNSLA